MEELSQGDCVVGMTASLGILLPLITTVPSSPSRLHHQLQETSQASLLRLISTLGRPLNAARDGPGHAIAALW